MVSIPDGRPLPFRPVPRQVHLWPFSDSHYLVSIPDGRPLPFRLSLVAESSTTGNIQFQSPTGVLYHLDVKAMTMTIA